MYFSDGSFKWYEEPFAGTKAGETYTLNLYFSNPTKGTAVKYVINVEFVNEIDNAEYCRVRRLPAGMDTPTGIENLTPTPSQGVGAIYNLNGQRVNELQKGLNIVDGKKVLVK